MGFAAILPWTGLAVIFVLLAGLVGRRRIGLCWTFPLYLGTIALADLLMLAWPDQFGWQWFWLGKELLITILRFALALELTYRTVRAFPTARATVRGVLLGVLLLTLWIVFAGTGDLSPREGETVLGPLISRVQPLVLYGAIWLLTGIAAVILWYRLPVHPLHKAILVGLVPYLLVFTISLNLIESWGWWEVDDFVIFFPTLAWLLVLGFWAVVAWRPGDVPVQAPAPGPSLRRATG
jgi:hypothetical protein